jgi:dTDP-4-amino-4,6-dideoxygalactose transaminase
VPLTDPRAQYLAMRQEIDSAISDVLKSGYMVLGPQVDAFEGEFAAFLGTEHAIGVANGTDAIAIALMALGIGSGDEVITVSHTAVATVAGIEQAGATPVLVDVEPGFLTLSPESIVAAVTDKTRAVIPVHIYGQSADLSRIKEICETYRLSLIEDTSQAHGAAWRDERLGTIGDIGVFSCYPTKNLSALGDAGVIVTRSSHLADRMRRLRQYGWQDRNWSLEPGVNSRLDEIQAAVLRVKLRHLEESNNRRREIAAIYATELGHLPLVLPTTSAERHHVYHLYVVEVEARNEVMARLGELGIQTAIHYPTPIHLQPAYLDRIRVNGELHNTEKASFRILSLPLYPEMTSEMQSAVVSALLNVC